jgi:hypothetical protein
MARRVPALLAAALMLLTLASPTLANTQPFHDFYEPGGFEFAQGEVCADFAVGVEVLRGRAHDQIREGSDGSVHIRTTGVFIARVINRTSGESLVRNFSGPVDFVFRQDGTGTSWNRGHTLAWLIPDEGGPALWHHRGTIRWEIDANGLFTIVRETGTREDLCAALAS